MTKSEELKKLGEDCNRECEVIYSKMNDFGKHGRREDPPEVKAIKEKYQQKYKNIIDKYNRTPE